MKTTWFETGSWNAICDVCGFKFKAAQLRERWDGLRVCEEDWETRHPQELIRPINEDTSVPWTSPEGEDVFIGPDYDDAYEAIACTDFGRSAIPEYAIPGCMIPGNIFPPPL